MYAIASAKTDPATTKDDTLKETGFKRAATTIKKPKTFDLETKAFAGDSAAKAQLENQKEADKAKSEADEKKEEGARKPLTNTYVENLRKMKSMKGHQMEDMADNMKQKIAGNE